MLMPRPGAPDPAHVVRMFDRIAPIYDAMNTLMTAGLDARWRAAAVRQMAIRPGDRVLDVATGTGKLALAATSSVGPGGHVVGLDASERMLRRARRASERAGAAVDWRLGDALALPFPDATFDAVSIGFGLRNLPDIDAGLRELSRVLRPGGRLVVLEIAEPPGGIGRLLFATWFRRVVPRLGQLAGRGAAYAYLPTSLERYPAPDAVARRMRMTGLAMVGWRRLPTGMATVHRGTRAGGS